MIGVKRSLNLDSLNDSTGKPEQAELCLVVRSTVMGCKVSRRGSSLDRPGGCRTEVTVTFQATFSWPTAIRKLDIPSRSRHHRPTAPPTGRKRWKGLAGPLLGMPARDGVITASGPSGRRAFPTASIL